MKFKQAIAIGALGCISFVAIAQQQQSPFITPAPQAAAGGPIVLNLTGVTVTDPAGQPVGPIQHILLSPAGCVDMAVLSLGAQKLVPVPWTLVGSGGASVGAARAETATGGATLALKVDRTVLQQAPTITINQLSQPQMVQQVKQYFVQYEQQSATGGTTSQTGVNAGAGASTNRIGASLTNAASGSITNASTNQAASASTNQTGILSPTGPTNATPGRPAFETNRPNQPSIIPPGRPGGPPANRPPANRPPTNTPGPGAGTPGGATPNNPGL